MKKTFFLITTIALALSACSEEQGNKIKYKLTTGNNLKILPSDTPLPETPKMEVLFPTEEELANKIAENKQYINNKITQKDGKTIHYFTRNDKNEYYLEDKTKAKFYRVVLGKTAENHCAVQDFYINGKKYTEEYIVLDTNCAKDIKKSRMYNINTNFLMRNFSTFVQYTENGNVFNVLILNRQNRTANFFIRNEKVADKIIKERIADIAINFDLNLNQNSTYFKDPSSFNVFKFNDHLQTISMTDVASKPIASMYDIDKDENVSLQQYYGIPFNDGEKLKATRITCFDFDNNNHTFEYWAVSDNGKTVVRQVDKYKYSFFQYDQRFAAFKTAIKRD